MKIRTFAELIAPDERTLRFTPLGLSMGGMLNPEGAAEFEQQAIASADLVAEVPEGVRNSFERLRTLHSYGVLWYDAFTVADDLCFVVMEQALRARFEEFHGDASATGAANSTSARAIKVPRGLSALLSWARREGLLRGQRNKRLEPLWARMRNHFAHGESYHLGMPNDSARSIHDVAEIINHLWGASTPGGRLHPAPLPREVLGIGWDGHGSRVQSRPEQILGHLDAHGSDWSYLLLRAVPDEHDLSEFDSRYEMTAFPCELLWGPGRGVDAFGWWEQAQPAGDYIEYLDRLFVVRADGSKVYLAQRPDVMLGLPPENRGGIFHLIRADFPLDAFNHIRHLPASCRSTDEPFRGCAVEEVAHGSWDTVRSLLTSKHHVEAQADSPRVSVPRWWPFPDQVGFD